MIQRVGLAGYGLLARSGLMRRPLVRRAFDAAYEIYKERLEAGPIDELRALVPAGSLVVDVGANVGFFTRRFAAWVGDAGRVVAIEPDAENFRLLTRRLEREGLANRVECHQAVAADEPGTRRLRHNPVHPGDHRISTDESGVDVRSVTVDGLVAGADRRVSLVKIDVQGAELLVLAGARRTLDQGPPLFVEIDRAALAGFDTTPEAVVAFLARFGYRMHALSPNGSIAALDSAGLAAAVDGRGYADVLFVRALPSPR